MNKIEFNTQIATTIEQSKRLLELGLNHETSDMLHYKSASMKIWGVLATPYSKEVNGLEKYYFPAWSLHRLIAMLPDKIEVMPHSYFVLNLDKNSIAYIDSLGWGKVVCERGLFYDNIIDCIEWLIQKNYFNKEYLK